MKNSVIHALAQLIVDSKTAKPLPRQRAGGGRPPDAPVSVSRTKTNPAIHQHSRDVSEVVESMIIQNIISMFCYLLQMKVGDIVTRQLLLVDSKQKRAKTQLRKPVKLEKLARKQTYRWNGALDAIPS